MTTKTERQTLERRALPFFVEFVKFAAAFSVIVMFALVAMTAAAKAMQ